MSARLRGIAKETERIVASGGWTTRDGHRVSLTDAIASAAAGTRLYGPEPVPVPEWAPVAATAFEVTGEGSLDAARRVAGDGPVAVLNFASARNPGGGYLNGAQAQEEALCRGSALYRCLREVPEYYAAHRADPSPFYSDRVIHSPGVPVFRDDRGMLLDAPFRAGFLTSPAPNAGVISRRDPAAAARVPAALAARAERVLEVAAAHDYRQLVLGAWGCGVFMNDPAEVAAAFRTPLTGRFADRFDRVVFAILDRRADSPTRAAFAAAFPGGTAARLG
ncbi:TIGR02452 family protein [Streptomyces albireticuli]|uniref:TIGR02452 family protein n=1 Tax=Streptomyces albireticuli TaxID=1940 RepID=A0A2A2DFI2_9ACTN|nr:TIGR02452 family protein [Streptomyces albireticuli]MCD9145756.1 TIGR02452 family protein [Streptomyces albireticuli]MCD9165833.1 TIGR02452 family protein [Streptomyces albireticuli]MCD9194488.1 TIGR02452 family protein [Streptomyces albireticuli]PAU50284.1 TIGR02452 family protein [Streptomyces albireticuli]